jgi:hypothetical protein
MKCCLPLLLLLPLLYAPSATAEAPLAWVSTPGQSPIALVQITRLTGTGPDGREHVLYEDKSGYATTLDALGRVGSQVSAGGLAEGGYHTLFVELADGYRLLQPNGKVHERRLSEFGQPRRIRIRGMVMVRNGQATPLRMLEATSYYAAIHPRSRKRDDDD